MQAALQNGQLTEAISHLYTLLGCSPPHDRRKVLTHHRVNSTVPTLHHLCKFNYQEKDAPQLYQIINLFTNHGYDVNGEFFPTQHPSFKKDSFTALLASIVAKKPILVDCLLRNGARADICSERGISPCHVAIKIGDLNCLQTLVKFGGPSIVTSTSRKQNLPLLHTAVDQGHTEILSYLLSNEEFKLDPREKAVYPNGEECTPLDRAFGSHVTREPTIRGLLQAIFKETRYRELYISLVEGDPLPTLNLLKHFSPEELAQDKIEDRYPLHCLSYRAFRDECLIVYTNRLISDYVGFGWNVNSEGSSYFMMHFDYCSDSVIGRVSKYTLLHLACYHVGQLELIKYLVGELGADVNCETTGDLELTPLFIAILRRRQETAEYLLDMGADLNFRGKLAKHKFSRFMKRNLITGEWERFSSLNSVELLLRRSYGHQSKLLQKMLSSPVYIGNGADEFHLAIEGGNLGFARQVVKKYGPLISSEDLLWMVERGVSGIPERIPSIHFLLSGCQFLRLKTDVTALAFLLHSLVNAGLDLNLIWKDISIFDLHLPINSKPVLGFLQRILKIKDMPINAILEDRPNPVLGLGGRLTSLCEGLGPNCMDRREKPDSLWPIQAIKLLITHGLDMSGVVTEKNFYFHFGCSLLYQMMFAAGLKCSESFFKPEPEAVCEPEEGVDDKLLKELAELEIWKKDFDRKEGSSLKHKCRLVIRKQVKFVEDLDMLTSLAPKLQDFVLCKNYI